MNNMKPKPTVFLVTLRADGSKDDEEATRRLRAFLKAALRQWGLRCTSAEMTKEQDQ
jgi:hypothetical protein